MTEPLDPAHEPSEIVAETGAGHSATMTEIGVGGVRVEWTDNSNNEDNFRLTASIASTPAVFRNLLLPANTTSYDLVAPAGTRVCASVSAVNGAGPVSGGQVCITTPAS